MRCLKQQGGIVNIKLGQWAPYIELSHNDWFTLPGSLERDLALFVPDGTEMEPLPDKEFAATLEQAFEFARERTKSWPYHNLAHVREVLRAGLEIAEAYKDVTEHEVPKAVVQAFALALVLHDIAHPGSTFNGTDYSVEWNSAAMAEEFLAKHGFNTVRRLFVVHVIWASTYGANTEEGKRLKLDRVQPSTFYERAMVVADVAPNDHFLRWLEKGVNVLYGETPASPPPATWFEFLKNRIGFLEFYVIPKMTELDGLVLNPMPITSLIGWQSNAREFVGILKEIQKGKNPILATTIKSMLPKDRVDLNA
jgi:hypothetical protein